MVAADQKPTIYSKKSDDVSLHIQDEARHFIDLRSPLRGWLWDIITDM